jgi:single-strand DNA-binding protein
LYCIYFQQMVKKLRISGDGSDEASTVSYNRNEVLLEGRVTSQPTDRELPSGDRVVEFRIVIDRGKKTARNKKDKKSEGRREVDSLDIAAWSASSRKRALLLQVDDWVAVEGAIRRRFWKVPSGVASRWQVEASVLRRL